MPVSRRMPSRVLSAPRLGRLLTQNDDDDDDEEASLNDFHVDNNSSMSFHTDNNMSRHSMLRDYGFSDDEVAAVSEEDGSDGDLYLSDGSSEDEKEKNKKKKKARRSRNVDALISPPARKKKFNLKSVSEGTQRSPQPVSPKGLDVFSSPASSTGKKKKVKKLKGSTSRGRSSQGEGSLALDALLSPRAAGKKKKVKRSANKSKKKKSSDDDSMDYKKLSIPSTHSLSSSSTHSWVQDIESSDSDESDDDALEFGAKSPEDLLQMRKQALVEKALSMKRSSMMRTLNKKKDGTLSRSAHTQLQSQVQSPKKSRSHSVSKNNRSTDALGLSGHKQAQEAAEGLSRRNRRGTTKQDFLERSTPESMYKRSSSVKSLKKNRDLSCDAIPDYKPKRSSSVKSLRKNRDLSGDAMSDYKPKRSSSVKSLRKNRDMYSDDVPDYKPKRSSSVKSLRKNRDMYSDDVPDYTYSRASSASARRKKRDMDRAALRKKKKELLDDDKPQQSPKKKADSGSDSSDSDLSSVSDTDQNMSALDRLMASPRPVKAPSERTNRPRGEKLSRNKSPFSRAGSLRMSTAGLSNLTQRLNNMGLSTSEHGLSRPRRTPRGRTKESFDTGKDEGEGDKMKGRMSGGARTRGMSATEHGRSTSVRAPRTVNKEPADSARRRRLRRRSLV